MALGFSVFKQNNNEHLIFTGILKFATVSSLRVYEMCVLILLFMAVIWWTLQSYFSYISQGE